MAMVEFYLEGNCRIYIHDDDIAGAAEEEQILQSLAELYRRQRAAARLREQEGMGEE